MLDFVCVCVAYTQQGHAHISAPPPGGGGGRGAPFLFEVEPFVVRVVEVEVVVGAEVWVVKAVKVVEVRWSELPRPRLEFLALGLRFFWGLYYFSQGSQGRKGKEMEGVFGPRQLQPGGPAGPRGGGFAMPLPRSPQRRRCPAMQFL
jgi:hypothetical protein